jgi:hypothetical protein
MAENDSMWLVNDEMTQWKMYDSNENVNDDSDNVVSKVLIVMIVIVSDKWNVRVISSNAYV